jgi:hypothetical protein
MIFRIVMRGAAIGEETTSLETALQAIDASSCVFDERLEASDDGPRIAWQRVTCVMDQPGNRVSQVQAAVRGWMAAKGLQVPDVLVESSRA